MTSLLHVFLMALACVQFVHVFLMALTCVQFVYSVNDELQSANFQDVTNHSPGNAIKFVSRENVTLKFTRSDIESSSKRLEHSRSIITSRSFVCISREVDGKPVHRRLSSQVQLWSSEDIGCWIRQLGFDSDVVKQFKESGVDGDLLLVFNENNLIDDIKMTNGIQRKRFIRELNELRKNSDYSLMDSTRLNDFLTGIHPDLSQYTHRMLKSLVTLPTLPLLTNGELEKDCGVSNGIHRKLILNAAKDLHGSSIKLLSENSFDAFLSYRRDGGSLFASLIKELLEKRGQNVFLDVDKIKVGRFDKHLLHGISRSRNFILVLSPGSLDRCKGDDNGEDWLHREIVAALTGSNQIILVIHPDFEPPKDTELPEDMGLILMYEGVIWNHVHYVSCVEKLLGLMNDRGGHDPIE